MVLTLGLAVFVCGSTLIGLSLVYQHEQLWQLGLPMVLGGQVAILAVVIWQLESVWQSNRATFVALHAMDEQLRQLRRDTRSGRTVKVAFERESRDRATGSQQDN
jgi:hypothetical protein